MYFSKIICFGGFQQILSVVWQVYEKVAYLLTNLGKSFKYQSVWGFLGNGMLIHKV